MLVSAVLDLHVPSQLFLQFLAVTTICLVPGVEKLTDQVRSLSPPPLMVVPPVEVDAHWIHVK